jgi:hypothetical protein
MLLQMGQEVLTMLVGARVPLMKTHVMLVGKAVQKKTRRRAVVERNGSGKRAATQRERDLARKGRERETTPHETPMTMCRYGP